MKISEHKAETTVLIAKFESLSNSEPYDLLRLFDAIDFRLLDEQLWEQHGLSDEDDVPEAPTKLCIRSLPDLCFIDMEHYGWSEDTRSS